MPRLLHCRTCNTIDKVPDYDGDPRFDAAMQAVIDKYHTFDNGDTHIASPVMQCDQKLWDRMGDRWVLDQAKEKLQVEVRAMRDGYTEDAIKCFYRHGSPQMGCVDYCDSKKRIGNPSRHPGAPKIFLCHFCPVHHGFVATEERWKRGLYK